MKEAVLTQKPWRNVQLRTLTTKPNMMFERQAHEIGDHTWELNLLAYWGESNVTVASRCTLQEAMSWVIEAELPLHNNLNQDQDM